MSALSLLKQKLSQKASDSTDQQSNRIADGSAIAIIRMMASKAVDESRIAALIDPKLADPALPDRMIGRQVTYGDLKTKLDNTTRPNGSVGVHYPAVYSLSMAQADTVYQYLDSLPTASGRQGGYRRQQQQPAAAAATQTADSGLSGEVASLKADMSALIELLPQIIAEATQSATPTEGHSKVAPAEPVQQTGPVYRPGDVILMTIDGETVARQITADGKRLNKTIVG